MCLVVTLGIEDRIVNWKSFSFWSQPGLQWDSLRNPRWNIFSKVNLLLVPENIVNDIVLIMKNFCCLVSMRNPLNPQCSHFSIYLFETSLAQAGLELTWSSWLWTCINSLTLVSQIWGVRHEPLLYCVFFVTAFIHPTDCIPSMLNFPYKVTVFMT